jgi:hypothetical protein
VIHFIELEKLPLYDRNCEIGGYLMNLEKLTNEELLKNYERLAKRPQDYLTDEEAEYKEKIKEELLKRIG